MPPAAQNFAIGIDIGATKIASVLLSETGELVDSLHVLTLAHEGPQAVFDKVAEQILNLAKQKPEAVVGVGIGSPGKVDSNQGVVYNAVNLGWTEVSLADEISRRIGRLPVWIQKDANLNASVNIILVPARVVLILFISGLDPGWGQELSVMDI